MPTSASKDEEEKLIAPIAEKPIQKETVETKRTGAIGGHIFMRYIRAGGCGIFGLSCLFALFALTSATVLFSNWWLGRWSNSERIRYSFTNTTVNNCSTDQQSKVNMMTTDEWFRERDKFFYVLLGRGKRKGKTMKFGLYCLGLSLLSVVMLFIRTMSYFVSCHITARSLHNQMFNALLRAPVFFFDSNPIGEKAHANEHWKLIFLIFRSCGQSFFQRRFFDR